MGTQSVKDILNTEIPKPSFVLRPSVPAPLPSDVTLTRSGGDDVARTLDPYSGKFEQVAEDTPRIYGGDQSLFVEAAQRTNHVRRSSDIDSGQPEWFETDISSSTTATSIIKKQTAHQYSGTSSIGELQSTSLGSFSSGEEVAYLLIENLDADESDFILDSLADGADQGRIRYDWVNDQIMSTKTIGLEANVRKDLSAPNGGTMRWIQIRYDSSSASGEGRKVSIRVNRGGKTDGTAILHHFQIEEAPNASSPIVTSGSATTRAADNFEIPVGYWFNSSEMTFYLEFIPLTYHRGANEIILGKDSNTTSYFEIAQNNEIFAQDSSSGDVARPSETVTPFQKSKVAVALTPSEMRLSHNGVFDKNTYGGHHLDSPNTLPIGANNNTMIAIKELSGIPRALPEPTLNTLTS